jgi:hypothetical protein
MYNPKGKIDIDLFFSFRYTFQYLKDILSHLFSLLKYFRDGRNIPNINHHVVLKHEEEKQKRLHNQIQSTIYIFEIGIE